MRHFVILRHHVPIPFARDAEMPAVGEEGESVCRSTHFDWMLEYGGVLKTWATEPLDSMSRQHECTVEPIADHRLDYLQYEGEISRDRGRVERIVAGRYEPRRWINGEILARLFWVDSHGVDRQTELTIYRKCFLESPSRVRRAVWRLRVSPCR